MKDYNAEKIFLTNFLHVSLKAFKLLALDNFAGGGGGGGGGGYTESLACSQFLVTN